MTAQRIISRGFRTLAGLRYLGLAAIAPLLFAATAHAQSNGDADVEIMTPVVVQNDGNMDFGTIIPGTGLSRLRIDPDTGVLTVFSGNATIVGGTVSRATFTVSGDANERVRITLSQNRVDLTRVGGTETMRLNRFRLDGGRNRFLDTTGTAQFAVGGQIRVTANQAAGVYQGSFALTVDYF
jgi:hypothetical protein